MEITVKRDERLSVSSEIYPDNLTIDIYSEPGQYLSVALQQFRQYIEIRKKENGVRVFIFNSKGEKKKADLGWWDDAEVIFALNEVLH